MLGNSKDLESSITHKSGKDISREDQQCLCIYSAFSVMTLFGYMALPLTEADFASELVEKVEQDYEQYEQFSARSFLNLRYHYNCVIVLIELILDLRKTSSFIYMIIYPSRIFFL